MFFTGNNIIILPYLNNAPGFACKEKNKLTKFKERYGEKKREKEVKFAFLLSLFFFSFSFYNTSIPQQLIITLELTVSL